MAFYVTFYVTFPVAFHVTFYVNSHVTLARGTPVLCYVRARNSKPPLQTEIVISLTYRL